MRAPATDHLDLSARLASHHHRRQTALPRRARRHRWGSHERGGRRGRGRAFLTSVDPRWQRSTVKASYSRNGRSASWAAHGTYLAREGAQREGGKGRGFDAEKGGVDLTATLRSWQQAGDARLWKFIVSPEHGERLDLKAHARALVSHMERDLGTRLEWVAIDHYNTDNPHVHLLVRGRDTEGRALQIHPDYLRQGIRRRSQDLATQALGFRSEHEIVQSRGRELLALIETILDASRIEAGHLELKKTPLPVSDLVAESIRTARELAVSGRSVTWEADAGLPDLPVDTTHAARALGAVVAHALRAAKDGDDDVVGVAGDDDADRRLPVVGAVVGVDRPIAGAEADLAADRRRQVAGEGRRVDAIDAVRRQRPVAAVARAAVAVLALPALDRGVYRDC